MRKCLAGPYIGEFGWELFNWQGYLRKRRSDYDYMTVISRPGHAALYEDFADEFIECPARLDRLNMWKGGIDVAPIVEREKDRGGYTDFIPFDSYKWRNWQRGSQEQAFIRYGKNTILECDILIHVRSCFHCRSGFRNWQKEDAEAYAEWAQMKLGCSVASIGKSETSLYIPGTTDMMNVSLGVLVDFMASSRLIIGSQSGPHHLAALCGLPIIAWQTKPEHAERLSKHWNPFGVKTITNATDISYWKQRKHWQPSLEWMQEATVEML